MEGLGQEVIKMTEETICISGCGTAVETILIYGLSRADVSGGIVRN